MIYRRFLDETILGGDRRWARAVVALSLFLAATAQPRLLHGQSAVVRGVIVDSSGHPIGGALVSVDGGGFTRSDAKGSFVLTGVPPGTRIVRVRAIAWKPLAFEIDLDPGSEHTGRIGLEPAPVLLPELKAVGGRGFDTPASRRLAGFEARRRVNAGTFRDRAAIDRMVALSTVDLLKNIPGVRVSSGPTGGHVTFARCVERVSVWIDGDKVRTPSLDVALGLIHPNDIEAIEIYRGLSQIPAEFLDDSCAAVVIWTRAHP